MSNRREKYQQHDIFDRSFVVFLIIAFVSTGIFTAFAFVYQPSLNEQDNTPLIPGNPGTPGVIIDNVDIVEVNATKWAANSIMGGMTSIGNWYYHYKMYSHNTATGFTIRTGTSSYTTFWLITKSEEVLKEKLGVSSLYCTNGTSKVFKGLYSFAGAHLTMTSSNGGYVDYVYFNGTATLFKNINGNWYIWPNSVTGISWSDTPGVSNPGTWECTFSQILKVRA